MMGREREENLENSSLFSLFFYVFWQRDKATVNAICILKISVSQLREQVAEYYSVGVGGDNTRIIR